ncbi:MAG: phosphate-starvation-inducible PsiE family protein [Candidatus Methanoperedens sp.]|nr:phosphate-starvation-inducible PsiE family protein [Candidatus Methanoperedens sp.]
MLEYLKKFEKIIVMLLAVMMSLVVLLSVIELGWILLNDIITPPVFLLNINELLDIFGLFLLVLIGIELLYTIKAYAMESVIHAEVVLTVAMIAIGRKVIILDIKEISGLTLIGIGAVIIALSVGYYYFKKGLYIDESNPAP